MVKGQVPGFLLSLPFAGRFWRLQQTQGSTYALVQQGICTSGEMRRECLFASATDEQEHQPLDCKPDRNVHAKTYDYSLWKGTVDGLDQIGFDVDIGTFASLLVCSAHARALLDGKRVHIQIIKRGLQQNLLLGNLLVQMYSNCRALEHARDVFIKMPQRDAFACSFMMRAYAQHGFGEDALQVFEQMQQEGIIPSKFIFISIFCVCASQAAILEGQRMHARITGTEFMTDIAVYTSLLGMYGKCGSPEYARWIFNRMPERDVVAWNALLAAYSQHDQGKDALQTFQHMQQQGITPSKVTFIHIFEVCATETALIEGMQMHSCILDSEVESDIMVGTALVIMYGKCGSIEYMQKMFCKMALRDEILWSAMIAACAQNGNNTLKYFKQMQHEGTMPNKFIYSSILSACASQVLHAEGKQMHARIIGSQFELDVVVGNALINLYGKLGLVEDARNVFDKMIDRDLISWNAMIAAYAQHEHFKGSLQVFGQMQQEGVVADKVTFVNILSVCTGKECLSGGKILHAYTVGSCLDSDVTVGNALLNMYGRCASLDSMRVRFDEMPKLNLVSWNTVISLYAQDGKSKDALQLFEQMQEEGFIPDKLTCTSILSVFASQGALEEGRWLHYYLIISGFEADYITGSALINLYGKCGSLTEARRMFDSMPDQDVVTWNAMIATYAHNGQGKEAIHLFNQMQRGRVKPTSVTFISVLFACSHTGLVDQACRYFDSMVEDYCITPAVDHYNCMIDVLGRAGRLDEAEELLNKMSEVSTVASWMSLLGACRNQGDFERGERTAKKVFHLDPENPSPYVMLYNIYATVGREDDALKVINMMKNQPLRQQPGCSFFMVERRMHDVLVS